MRIPAGSEGHLYVNRNRPPQSENEEDSEEDESDSEKEQGEQEDEVVDGESKS